MILTSYLINITLPKCVFVSFEKIAFLLDLKSSPSSKNESDRGFFYDMTCEEEVG